MRLSQTWLEYIHTEQDRAIRDMQKAGEEWRRGACFWDSQHALFKAAGERFTALSIISSVFRHQPGDDMEILIQRVQKLVKP